MSAATFLASIDEEDMARQSFGDKEFLITLSDEYSDNSLKDNPLDDKMLRMECLYYVFGTMAITFIFGTAAGYILCQIFNQVGVFGKLHYTFPFLQVLLFFAVLVVIALIYSTLAIRYCHKQSLVDRIKTME